MTYNSIKVVLTILFCFACLYFCFLFCFSLTALQGGMLFKQGSFLSRVHTTQTSPDLAQVFNNLGLAHASVGMENLGLA